MKYVRLFAGADGLSHFEDVEVVLTDNGQSADQSALMPAAGLVMRRTRPDYNYDFHTAPRRQFIINLEGWLEIEASDGEVRRFGPGSVVLADDLTGKGHISRAVDGQERLSILVPLAE